MFFLLGGLLAAPCNIHPEYMLVPATTAIRVVHAGSRFTASTTVSFRVHEVRPAIIPMVEPGVLEHVRGHQIIAQRIARSFDGHLDANGTSVAQAKMRLSHAIHDLAADQNTELAREEQTYENVTENGASQSQGPTYGLPGGSDVHDAACTH